MVCRARREAPVSASRGRRGLPLARTRAAVLLLAGAALTAAPARGEEHVLVGGLFDAEYWQTDDGSRLLSRNYGDAAPGGRLRLWAATEFRPRLQGFALGQALDGRANVEDGAETSLEQAFVRYTLKEPRHLVIEAGQLVSPIGNFSRRYLSSVNPLVGSPDGYSLDDPLGAQITGRAGRFDYRVAMVDRPFVNDKYVPPTGRALRPALAAGFTPTTGTRIGVYATAGPYLGPRIQAMLAPGERWREYDQTIYGLDVQFSHGYFELNGDYARSTYEVPAGASEVGGFTWFIEPKYTWTPRFFTALRLERNDYPFISPLAPAVWLATTADFYDAEAAAGWRIAAGAVVKVSYRRDRWMVDGALRSFFPDGYALSAQLSYSFNVNSWLERPR